MNATLLELEAADGVRIVARRWPTTTSRTGLTAVVAHGFAASGTEPRVSAVAETLVARGHAVLTYDSRGHGESGGEATLGDDEALDVAAVVQAAGSDPVVLVGASMGAIGVLRYATGQQSTSALTGVVVVSCPARWSLPRNARGVLSALMTHTPLGRWGARRYMNVRIAAPRPRPAPPIDLVPALHRPLAIVHGADDPFIPVADAEALHAVANEPRRLQVVDGLGHAYGPEALMPVADAVDWVIDPDGP